MNSMFKNFAQGIAQGHLARQPAGFPSLREHMSNSTLLNRIGAINGGLRGADMGDCNFAEFTCRVLIKGTIGFITGPIMVPYYAFSGVSLPPCL